MPPKSEEQLFIEQNQGLVVTVATRMKGQLDLACDLDELVSFGLEGLLEAKRRYDASRGVRFSTFAYYRIRGAMLDGVRKLSFLPRRAHEKLLAAEAESDILETLGEGHAAATAQGAAQNPVEKLDDALTKITASFLLTIVAKDPDLVAGSPEEELIERDRLEAIRGVVDSLPEQERAIVVGFYYHGKQFEAVAKEIGISKSWASRLHVKALEHMKLALAEYRQ